MNFIAGYVRRLKIQYTTLVIFLLVMLAVGKYWSADPNSVISETFATAKVIAVSEKQSKGGGVGSNLSLVTVRLESGDKARVSVNGELPELGGQIRVKVRDFQSGARRVVAAADY